MGQLISEIIQEIIRLPGNRLAVKANRVNKSHEFTRPRRPGKRQGEEDDPVSFFNIYFVILLFSCKVFVSTFLFSIAKIVANTPTITAQQKPEK